MSHLLSKSLQNVKDPPHGHIILESSARLSPGRAPTSTSSMPLFLGGRPLALRGADVTPAVPPPQPAAAPLQPATRPGRSQFSVRCTFNRYTTIRITVSYLMPLPVRAESRWLCHVIQGWCWPFGHNATIHQPPAAPHSRPPPYSLLASQCRLIHDVRASLELAPY